MVEGGPACWGVLGARRTDWTLGNLYCWDRLGSLVDVSNTQAAMNAFERGLMVIAQVEEAHGVRLGPNACMQLWIQGKEDCALLSEVWRCVQ